MANFGLVRRREIRCPTRRGWAVLLAAVAAAVWFVGANAYSFLAVDEPVGASTLVVEGWISPAELAQAVVAFRSGGYRRVVTTGGPVEGWPELIGRRTFADLAAEYLTEHGLAPADVVAVPAPASAQDRTFLSAVMVRDWAQKSGVELRGLDVFSAGTHARRTRMMYRLAFGPDVDVGIMAAKPVDPLGRPWWRTSGGVKDVVVETMGFVWAKCFFWPGPPGSHEERWAVPPSSERRAEPR